MTEYATGGIIKNPGIVLVGESGCTLVIPIDAIAKSIKRIEIEEQDEPDNEA